MRSMPPIRAGSTAGASGASAAASSQARHDMLFGDAWPTGVVTENLSTPGADLSHGYLLVFEQVQIIADCLQGFLEGDHIGMSDIVPEVAPVLCRIDKEYGQLGFVMGIDIV